MNPYEQRIEDLHNHLASAWGQCDRQATELLLASQIASSTAGCRYPWFVLETDYPSRTCPGAWFAFGSLTPEPQALCQARLLRPRHAELLVNDWLSALESDSPGLLVDSEWRRGIGEWRRQYLYGYGILLSKCLRLRTNYPKSAVGLSQGGLAASREAELRRLAGRVLDNQFRSSRSANELSNVPAELLYWCELLVRVSHPGLDWEALTGSLAALALRRAALFNRPVEQSDWEGVERVMRDMIPVLARSLVEIALVRGTAGAGSFEVYKAQAFAQTKHVDREVDRLVRNGVLSGVRLNRQEWKARKGRPHLFRCVGENAAKYGRLIDRTAGLFQRSA